MSCEALSISSQLLRQFEGVRNRFSFSISLFILILTRKSTAIIKYYWSRLPQSFEYGFSSGLRQGYSRLGSGNHRWTDRSRTRNRSKSKLSQVQSLRPTACPHQFEAFLGSTNGVHAGLTLRFGTGPKAFSRHVVSKSVTDRSWFFGRGKVSRNGDALKDDRKYENVGKVMPG